MQYNSVDDKLFRLFRIPAVCYRLSLTRCDATRRSHRVGPRELGARRHVNIWLDSSRRDDNRRVSQSTTTRHSRHQPSSSSSSWWCRTWRGSEARARHCRPADTSCVDPSTWSPTATTDYVETRPTRSAWVGAPPPRSCSLLPAAAQPPTVTQSKHCIAACNSLTNTHIPYAVTVLSATRQRWHSRL